MTTEPINEEIHACGCNFDVYADGRREPAVVCEHHVGRKGDAIVATEPSARQEAEKIVGTHEAFVIEAVRKTADTADWTNRQSALVDALAAAKRVEDAHGVYEDVRMDDAAGDMAEGDALDELRFALVDLSEALSALREE